MAKRAPNQQLAVALCNRLEETRRLLEQASQSLVSFRESFPRLKAADILSHAAGFDATGAAIGRQVADVRVLAFKITGGKVRLREAMRSYPEAHRTRVEQSLDQLADTVGNLKHNVASLGFVAGTHLVYLDALLRSVGEATGMEATYNPRRPAMYRASMGIVDRTA